MVVFVGHLIDEPLDAGVFLTQNWTNDHDAPPSREQVLARDPYPYGSIAALWDATEVQDLLRMQFTPMAPYYGGPVSILTSGRTASASEASSDALQGSGRAILIGERTAGDMLLQQPFDVVGGYHLYLPVADYLSHFSGRIEGRGLIPDVPTSAETALDVALDQAVDP